MREGVLGNKSQEMENYVMESPFCEIVENVGEEEELGLQMSNEMGNGRENNMTIDLDDKNGRENSERFAIDDRATEDFSMWANDVESAWTITGGGNGSQGVSMDVTLNLGLGVDPSSSSSPSLTTSMGGETCDHDTPDWGTDFENETHCSADVPVSNVTGSDDRNNSDALKTGDFSDVQMYLSDDLLHMVFSYLNLIDLCYAARVCRQWRDLSSHEDLWCYLNFENRLISERQFGNMCRRYPNATAVNVYGTSNIFPLGMKALCSLRNLEVLTLGKGQLDKDFFEVLTGRHTLRSLTVDDATLGSGTQEISIRHDRLHDLRIVKCRVLRVSIRCPQLETLSLNSSSMQHAVLICPRLRELDIASCHKLLEAAIRSAAAACPLLESLDISNCPCVGDETLRGIASFCGNLHVLDASYCPNIVLESVVLPRLTVLKLNSCEGITSASMTAISNSSMLEVLELDNCSLLTSVSLDLLCLQKIRLVHCLKFVDLNLRSNVLSSVAVSNCPSLERISIASDALMKLVLQKQESLSVLTLECHGLEELDLTECESLTNSICKVFSTSGGCPLLRSLVLDSCESLTEVSFCSTSLLSLSLGGCRAMTSLDLNCPRLKHLSLDGCDHLQRAKFSLVNLTALNLGICPKLNVLHLESPEMVSLELKGCGVLTDAFIDCPLLTSLDASFCSQLKDDCLSAMTLSSPLIESLVLMSCLSVGPDGLSSLHALRSLTYLDLSYTFLVNLQPVFDSCLYLKVLKLQACKYLSDTSLEPLYKGNALPVLCELDLSYGALRQSAIEELLACCGRLTHISLNGCANMHDLDWGSRIERLSAIEGPVSRLLQNLNCVGCPNMKKLVIPSTARCSRLSYLNLSLSSNLMEVDISCCNLFILNLSNCYSLEILNLDCPRLTSLSLQACNMNVEAVEATIRECNMLETLNLRFCPKITPSSMVTLRTACPSLKRIFNSLVPV